MRLADQISEIAGDKDCDYQWCGAVAKLSEHISRAECFELESDVVETVERLRFTKPSSLVTALPFARMPYPLMWVEWRNVMSPYKRPVSYGEEAPTRTGVLIQQGETALDGLMSWVFQFRNEVMSPVPFGAMFDFTRQILDSAGLSNVDVMAGNSVWSKIKAREGEADAARKIVGHMSLAAPPHMWRWLKEAWPELPEEKRGFLERSYLKDLEGEPWFAAMCLVMLNTKGMLESERQDLSKLNRARGKSKRRALREFAITRLSVGRKLQKSGTGVTREMARQHLVRGHFKVRKGGVFWWSPFVRGNQDISVPRERYVVKG